MRALTRVAHRCRRRVLVLAPTGKAVDVAVREGAATRVDDRQSPAIVRDKQLGLALQRW